MSYAQELLGGSVGRGIERRDNAFFREAFPGSRTKPSKSEADAESELLETQQGRAARQATYVDPAEKLRHHLGVSITFTAVVELGTCTPRATPSFQWRRLQPCGLTNDRTIFRSPASGVSKETMSDQWPNTDIAPSNH